jgi:hypothetical protein
LLDSIYSALLVAITELSTLPISAGVIFELWGWEQQPVLDMDALCHIA